MSAFDSLYFHKKTAIKKFPKYIDDILPEEFFKKYFKDYHRFNQIPLVKPRLKQNTGLRKTLETRESTRKFSTKPICFKKLSSLLYFSAGINRQTGKRFYPSAGARYPLEIYIVIKNAANLESGCYHFNPGKNNLEFMWKLDNQEKKIRACFNQEWIETAGAIFIITAVVSRTQIKYGLRGYRYILIDTGHLCQNIYLTATNLGLKCCSIGGFLDEKLGKLLDLDKDQEAVVVSIALGN